MVHIVNPEMLIMSTNNAYLLRLSIDRDSSGLRDIILQNAELLPLNDLRKARNLSALHFPLRSIKHPGWAFGARI
jgi:hypothetical protein